MNNTIIFLRHAKTEMDRALPINEWRLSKVGEQQAAAVADIREFQDLDRIVASTEEKAFLTVRPLAEKLGKEVERIAELSELDRENGGFLEPGEFERTVERCMKRREESVHQWETADHALARLSRGVEAIDAQYEGETILIVGHGITINLYFASLLGQLNRAYERMKANDFCDWGIERNGKIIRDLGGEKIGNSA